MDKKTIESRLEDLYSDENNWMEVKDDAEKELSLISDTIDHYQELLDKFPKD